MPSTESARIRYRGTSRSNTVILFASIVLLVMTSVNFAVYNVLTTSHGSGEDLMTVRASAASKNVRQRSHFTNTTTIQPHPQSTQASRNANAKAARIFSTHHIANTVTNRENTTMGVEKTLQVLRDMGIKQTELDIHKQNLPPWSQILENYGGSDEPVILGLEYCNDYRKTTPLKDVALGPAGLFSTGTNLLYTLLKSNCQSPDQSRYGRQRPLKFNLMQVPWGKHNPEEARGVYEVDYMKRYVENPMTVLPVVSIRHAYTWMSAMCRHTYGTQWAHRQDFCDKTLGLKSPIEKVPYGATNGTQPIHSSYKSLAHMYMQWYRPYFHQHDYKRLMIRFEDLVYRPKEVVTQVCECVGGTMTGWKGKFQYKTKTSNKGQGHGQRSDLMTAFIKYGQPLGNFYAEYNMIDRSIMDEAFHNDEQDERGIFNTFKYKLER